MASTPTATETQTPMLPETTDPINLCYTNCGDIDEQRIRNLQVLLEKDLLAADLCWSFFVSACQSYRHDSGLRPFPPFFINEDTDLRDIDGLRSVISSIPPLPMLLNDLKHSSTSPLPPRALALLIWVLFDTNRPELSTVPQEDKLSIMKKCGSTMLPASPSHIVKVEWDSLSESKWQRNYKDDTPVYAFHGSRLDNFYSILHHGLQQHMSKNALFGQGIYLSSELGVSLPYSPRGQAWEQSILGTHFSCIAICEVKNHPDVQCETTEPSDRFQAPDSVGDKVPEKYFVVVNNELVRVQYLLVYCTQEKHYISQATATPSWVSEHKFLFVMMAYVLILVAVGIRDVPWVTRIVKRWVRYWTDKSA